MAWQSKQDYYVGDEAMIKRGILKLNYPIQNGIVTDWEEMEKIWQHTFYQELKQEPSEHPIMLTEIPMNPKYNRERMTQIMFETFNVPAMYVQIQAVLSSYASGLYNGIVVELGDSVSHIVPIFEGNSLPHSILRSEIAGKTLNDYLVKLFQERGHTFTTSAEMEIVRDIKEKLSFVTLNYEEDMRLTKESSTLEKPYELPDGTSIIVGSERFRCPEPLFSPSLIGKDTVGIGQMVYCSIQNCDSDLWSQLYQNIILSGGTSMFVGLEERLTVEVSKLAPRSMWVKVFAGPNRKFGA